jgi:hypothetical protein
VSFALAVVELNQKVRCELGVNNNVLPTEMMLHVMGIERNGVLFGRILSCLLFWVVSIVASDAGLQVSDLRCEYRTNPLGVHKTEPRLSWEVSSLERGQSQTAWRILVASTPEKLAADDGDLWDSGQVDSDETAQVSYAGSVLESRSRCHWKVKVWDQDGEDSEWSVASMWTVGLLDPQDWTAEWIDGQRLPAEDSVSAPEILSASYEAVDGAGSLDVKSQLNVLAAEGDFEIQISNETFGNDPAFNHVKHLVVEYRREGEVLRASFPEEAGFRFPDDLPPPIEATILSASWEALDGAGSRDVSDLLIGMAADGPFTIAVENGPLGGDPAEDHLKQLRIDYEKDGVNQVKFVAEQEVFAFPADLGKPTTVPYLRKKFSIDQPVQRATIYVTALGLYELRLNGERVGDHVLAPEWTDYDERVGYQEYDVTEMVRDGENVWGGQVAEGWFSGHIGNGGFKYWGTSPALLAQLEIEYEDGSKERVVTDGSWKIGVSPLIATDFMLGESYDARRELSGWDAPGFDASSWGEVTVRDESDRNLTGQVMEPSKELMTIPAKGVSQPEAGRWIYDLEQNMVGVIRLKIDAPEGTVITIRHGEMLKEDGTLYTENLRGAPSIDTYICRSDGEEIWQPKFTFHGFRYVELSGMEEAPPLDAVTGVVISSGTPEAGEFVCSNPQINQLQSNIVWGQRGNFLSVPTDCPQRDERLGWMGDAQVFIRTATYNSDIAAFYTKWMKDVNDAQFSDGSFSEVCPDPMRRSGTPGWSDAGVICPWVMYQAYGDKQILEECYEPMVAWIEWCRNHSTNGIRDRGSDYGDWLEINASTNKELIGTAYYAYSTSLVAKAAAELGKSEDVAEYQALFESIKQAFIERYVSDDGTMTGDTQCAYAMALKFDLLPDELRAAAADHLAQDISEKGDHLSTGFVGVGYLLPMLSEAGKTDVAYQLIEQDTFPSWLFSVKHGATTIWERWDGWTPESGFQTPIMNSFNHYSLGSCGEWLYSVVGGIDQAPDSAAYKEIVIRPEPGGSITSASARLDTIRGEVASRWKQHEEGFTLTVEIPANTTAKVYVPADDATDVHESGDSVDEAEGVTFLRMEGGSAVLDVVSGRYHFTTGTVAPDSEVSYNGGETPLRVRLSDLLLEEPASEFISVDRRSVGGACLSVDGEWLVYQPAEGTLPGDDWFSYRVRTEEGGIEVRAASVTVMPSDGALRAVSIKTTAEGVCRLLFEGVPESLYDVEYRDDLGLSGQWNAWMSVRADESGLFEVEDTPPIPSTRFYRASQL